MSFRNGNRWAMLTCIQMHLTVRFLCYSIIAFTLKVTTNMCQRLHIAARNIFQIYSPSFQRAFLRLLNDRNFTYIFPLQFTHQRTIPRFINKGEIIGVLEGKLSGRGNDLAHLNVLLRDIYSFWLCLHFQVRWCSKSTRLSC